MKNKNEILKNHKITITYKGMATAKKWENMRQYLLVIDGLYFDYYEGLALEYKNENERIKSAINCLCTDYLSLNEWSLNEDDFVANYCEGMKYGEIKELLKQLNKNNAKLEKLFTKEEIIILSDEEMED
jgi:hypothetical protein